jgi:hypothetical protein
MLGFNFGPNHKCVMRDNISKMGSEITISDRFIGSLDLKRKIENRCKQGRFRLVRFGINPNNTRLDTFSVWFDLDFWFCQFYPNHLLPYSH